MNDPTTRSPADDLLDGVAAFARFTGFSERRCYYLLESGMLPAGKIGAKWIGSKHAIAAYLSRVSSGQAAQCDAEDAAA